MVKDDPGLESDDNLIWTVLDTESARQVLLTNLTGLGKDQNSIAADPLFTDPDHGDFSVPDHSPLIKLGIKRLSIKQAGLLENKVK